MVNSLFVSPVFDIPIFSNSFDHHLFLGFSKRNHNQDLILLGNVQLLAQLRLADRADDAASQPLLGGPQ